MLSYGMVRLAETLDPRLDVIADTLVPLVRPELVLLFGSRAAGQPRADSDYDVMLVLSDGADVEGQRLAASHALWDASISADVLARSASDYRRRQHDPGCLEWLVSREGRVLYASGTIQQKSPAPRVRERSTEGEREWIRRADADYEEAENSLSVEPPRQPVPDAICFHAHACVEKLLKARVAQSGTFPPRTHELPELLALAADARNDADIVAACRLLQELYPKSRYPELPMPTLDEARRAFAAARSVRDRLRPRLHDFGGI